MQIGRSRFPVLQNGPDREKIKVEAAARESEKWAERGLLERSERGGESYIRLQRNSCGEIVPAPRA